MAAGAGTNQGVFISVSDLCTPRFARAVLVDARYSATDKTEGPRAFRSLRAKGAVFADVDSVLSGPVTATSGRHPLPAVEDFVAWCVARGIGLDDTPVVCYDAFAGALAASRAWWMLDALGVPAFILDGGLQAYLAAGLPTEAGPPPPVPSGSSGGSRPGGAWRFGREFKGAVDISDLNRFAVLEARSAARVTSTVRPVFPLDPVPGGIPGAASHEFQRNIDLPRGRLLPAQALKEQLSRSLNGQPAEKFAFSCGSGVTACHNIAVARHVGLGRPALYVGSWSQYSKVKKDEIVANAIKQHGMCMAIRRHNPSGAPIDTNVHAVQVNGKRRAPPFFSCTPIDKEMLSALRHLRVGEVADITFASGRTAHVDCTNAVSDGTSSKL